MIDSMDDLEIPQCDDTDPQSVLLAFIRAMNSWERWAWARNSASRNRQHADPLSVNEEILAEMNRVFSAYCTEKPRLYGRNGSFGHPPEYDPDREVVSGCEIDRPRRRALVYTVRESLIGGRPTRRRYTLVFKYKIWRLDNVAWELDGHWVRKNL